MTRNLRAYVALAGMTYGFGFALVGFLLGRPDDQSAVRYNLGHAYAAVGNIVSAGVGTLWILAFRPSAIGAVPVYVAIIVAFAAIGVVLARRSIKGMSRERLFQ